MENLLAERVPIRMVVCSVAKAPLSQHRQMQCGTGLGKDSSGIVMGHIADIIVIDLEKKEYNQCMTTFYFSILWKCLNDISKRSQRCKNVI
jgi:hypothetical protein